MPQLRAGEFQAVERVHMPGRQFTTAKTIAAEHEIISRVRAGRNQADPALSRPQAISVADQNSHLNGTQRTVIKDVLSSPDRIQDIQGYAGSGKTTTLSVIRNAAEAQGYQVEGFAPTYLRTAKCSVVRLSPLSERFCIAKRLSRIQSPCGTLTSLGFACPDSAVGETATMKASPTWATCTSITTLNRDMPVTCAGVKSSDLRYRKTASGTNSVLVHKRMGSTLRTEDTIRSECT